MQELYRMVLENLGLQLSSKQMDAFGKYEAELLEWNTRHNLTAIRSPEMIRIKHFLDSLTCLKVIGGNRNSKVVDIGSGAGFPGIPLKIAAPSFQVTLVESIQKKAEFCRTVIKTLRLEQIDVLAERAETLAQTALHRQQYDWAVARAVSSLPVLVELLLPFVRIGGNMVAMKGESAPQEIHESEFALRMLGGRLKKLEKIVLPRVVDERYLVVIEKVAATPDAYPRRPGIPGKTPLLAKER